MIVAAMTRTLLLAVVALTWFQLAWGLNYARPPVDERLALPRGVPVEEEVAALLARAVDDANRDHPAAHAAGFPGARDVPAALVAALHEVEREDGRPRPTVPGRPKLTLLAPYFRMAGVDGLTAPAMLETLLNPDLTGPERPFVVAHEWAHLAGYAPEADANFVAWRVTQRAGVASRYSGWLFLLGESRTAGAARARRREASAELAAGPRDDLAAIDRRAAAQVDLVQRVGWRVYDGYLRSQGVPEGVRQLFAGGRADRPGRTAFVPRTVPSLTNQTPPIDVSPVSPSRQGVCVCPSDSLSWPARSRSSSPWPGRSRRKPRRRRPSPCRTSTSRCPTG